MKRTFKQVNNRLSALALGGAVVLAGSALAFTEKTKAETHNPPVKLAVDERPVNRDTQGRASYAPVIKRVGPGVVKVFTSTKAHATAYYGPPGMEDFFHRFFGEQYGGQMPQPQLRTPRQEGIGSGVIISKDGYILTNNHVVDGADEVKVALQDGRQFTAKVIGRDPKTDVAVIKVAATDLPAVPLADSDKIEVGDVVLAIGNPFGIGQTVTSGIVSATNRGGGLGLDYEDFIQTDAAINPGNSGGALVDVDGRLIGINTAILSRSGGNQGIGFAIPVNLARDVMESLIKDGRVARGYLGLLPQDLNPTLAKEFKLKDTAGVLVGDVTPDSPADKAGIHDGDVITEFNGKKITDSRQFRLQVARTTPGDSVPLKFLRDGAAHTTDVKVRARPGEEQIAKADKNKPEADDNGTLNGVTVADLDRRTRQEVNAPESLKGAVITEVKPDSPAAEAGLRPGDVIQEINHKTVKTAEEAVKLTEHPADKKTLLRVWRGGNSHYLVVDESDENKAG